jgi:hypothetical protein
MKLLGLGPNFYIHVCVSDLYFPRIAHRYINVEIWRQNIIILFWKKQGRGRAVSFLGIHKSEPDIYIGFSPALHLQCNELSVLLGIRRAETKDGGAGQGKRQAAGKVQHLL